MSNAAMDNNDRVQISINGPEVSSRMVTEQAARDFYSVGPTYRGVIAVLGLFFVIGLVALVLRFIDGYGVSERAQWGYYTATFAFLLMTAGSAPLLAVALRWTKNHWRRPFSRISELYGAVGLLTVLMFLPLMALLPPLEGRKSLWVSENFIGVPVWWDLFAVLGLVVCGLALLVLSAVPDMAILARHGDGPRARFLRSVTGFWQGTESQWNYHRMGLTALGAFYFMLLIMVQTMINVDFVMSLVPGWKDAIMPAHQALAGLQTAVGLTLVGAFILRATGRYKDFIPMESFWSLSKILLALSLLWAYFWFAGFVTFWYGRTPVEQNILKTFFYESYRIPFLVNFFLSFLVPFLMLIWNPVRKSILGPTIAGASVVVGAFFMTMRLYVPAMGMDPVTGHGLDHVPLPITPDVWDALIIIGAISGAGLIYMLATKIFPVISLWEVKEGLLYQRVRTMLRGRYMVLGKPE